MMADNPTLMDDFEAHSEASQPLDEILAMRGLDPKQMKPGQEAMAVNSAFTNN